MSRSTTPGAIDRRRFSVASYPTLSLLKSPQPSLDDLKLSHVLNGETCAPIAFADFASFVANKEFSAENLLFVVWYRSYRHRFERESADRRRKVPVPSTRLGDRYRPFAHIDAASSISTSGKSSHPAVPDPPRPDVSYRPVTTGFRRCGWADGQAVCGCADDAHGASPRRKLDPSPMPLESAPMVDTADADSHDAMVYDKVEDQPMRDEAVRAFSTFLKKGGSRELGISDELREFARVCLGRSTAPEVFEPIYEDIYNTLEAQSLPHFLSYAKANVNAPKQLFWYIVGAVDILIGVIIFVVLTLLLSPRHFAFRAIRLPSTIFTFFGAAQMYSAYRGFCSQVWGRAAAQLKPWEMDDGDEEDLVEAPLITPPPHIAGFDGGNLPRDGAHHTDRRSISDSSEIFTPEPKDADIIFASEVFPLSDLSGAAMTASSSSDDPPWLVSGLSNGPAESDDEMSEAARARLAVRRSTIKVPDAALAFPISEAPPVVALSARPTTHGLSDTAASMRDISPFEYKLSDVVTHISPAASSGNVDATVVDPGAPPRRASTVATDENTTGKASRADTSQVELRTLLARFSRTERRGAKAAQARPKTFGPERVVQDARVKALYESIVRDIVVFACIFAAVWIGVCFAVPTYGLAN